MPESPLVSPIVSPRIIFPVRPKPIQLGELLKKTFEEEQVLITGGLLNVGSLLIIGGPPKTYKSFVLNTLAYHLATATPIFNASKSIRGTEREPAFVVPYPQRVLILEQEIGEYDLQNRFQKLINCISPAEGILCQEKIYTYSCDANMRFDTADGRLLIRDLIAAVSPDVVCFDPFIEFHSIDENSSKEMSLVLHQLDKMRQDMKFTTILTHHTGKLKEGGRGGAEKLRGSSVLHGKGDAFMMLECFGQPGSGNIHTEFSLRRGKTPDDMYLKLDGNSLMFRFERWKNSPR